MVEFLVTVPGGTGGGYYIDGVQKPIVPVVTGGTFRFNQNDASNNGHPLILSSTTSTAGIISTGVSYYLDGASNSTNYRNTSLFNAATVRYIEITVAQTSDFYYICNVHGSGMGNVMDITSNTWSALSWSQGAWNNQGDQIVNITGNTLTITLGPQFGWGQSTWNSSEFQWGGLPTTSVAIGQQVDVNGLELTTTLDSVTELITVDTFPDGVQLNTTLGEVDVGPDANVTGESLTLVVGSVQAYNVEGWGRETWGEDVWGAEGLWESVSVTGQELIITQDNVDTDISVTVEVSSIAEVGWGIVGWGLDPWNESEVDITMSIAEGTVDPSPDAIVTGIGMTVDLDLGTVVIGTGNVEVTGEQLNIGQGTASGEALTLVDITGIGLTLDLGVVFAGAEVVVEATGNILTISQNSASVQSWTKINTGTVVTWTEIDTAA